MIDLHTHLLPSVDDGARRTSTAFEVLARFAVDGVRTVVCTPHLRASDVRRDAVPALALPFAEFATAWMERAPDGPALLRGWEILLDDPGVPLDDASLSLSGSHAVLVELPRAEIPPAFERELERLRASGVVPVVAHPERYAGVTVAHAQRWRAAGAALQGDATTLCGTGARAATARAFLSAGAYDVLASDNHGDARTLAVARDYLVAHDATDVATLLTDANPAALLSGRTCAPVRGVRVADGLAATLRAWFSARAARARTAMSPPS